MGELGVRAARLAGLRHVNRRTVITRGEAHSPPMHFEGGRPGSGHPPWPTARKGAAEILLHAHSDRHAQRSAGGRNVRSKIR